MTIIERVGLKVCFLNCSDVISFLTFAYCIDTFIGEFYASLVFAIFTPQKHYFLRDGKRGDMTAVLSIGLLRTLLILSLSFSVKRIFD